MSYFEPPPFAPALVRVGRGHSFRPDLELRLSSRHIPLPTLTFTHAHTSHFQRSTVFLIFSHCLIGRVISLHMTLDPHCPLPNQPHHLVIEHPVTRPTPVPTPSPTPSPTPITHPSPAHPPYFPPPIETSPSAPQPPHIANTKCQCHLVMASVKACNGIWH